jgi:hypothetical protein
MKNFDGRILDEKQQVAAALDAVLANHDALKPGEVVGSGKQKPGAVNILIGITEDGSYVATCPICKQECEYPSDVSGAEMTASIDKHMRFKHNFRGHTGAIERL